MNFYKPLNSHMLSQPDPGPPGSWGEFEVSTSGCEEHRRGGVGPGQRHVLRRAPRGVEEVAAVAHAAARHVARRQARRAQDVAAADAVLVPRPAVCVSAGEGSKFVPKKPPTNINLGWTSRQLQTSFSLSFCHHLGG